MTVMNVGKMRMRVGNGHVPMWMRVGVLSVPFKVVSVLMMLVVPVSMVVVQDFVSVRMFMPLTDMKPDSQSQEHGRNPERQRWHFWPEEER